MKNNIKYILILTFLMSLVSCDFTRVHYERLTDGTTPVKLVKELRENNLYKKFNGFDLSPRDRYSNLFLFTREEDPKIFYWLRFGPKGVEHLEIIRDYKEKNLSLLKEYDSTNYFNLERDYLEKAFDLITIMKKLKIHSADGSYGGFYCSFNDSSNLEYIKYPSELDSMFYRFRDNVEWIDSNFVTFY